MQDYMEMKRQENYYKEKERWQQNEAMARKVREPAPDTRIS